jgi:hypothetical protein
VAQRKSTRAGARASGETLRPLPHALTNLVLAEIVLRGARKLLRRRLEQRLPNGVLGGEAARRLVDGRSLGRSLALWAASRLATRSPLGLALVIAALAARLLYERGKQIEAERRRPPAGMADAHQSISA